MNYLLNPGLSIVIPIFNEAENIKTLFKKLQEFSEIAEFQFHFVLVDGCSSDGTPGLIKQEIESCSASYIELLEMNQRNGYGFDIMQGLNKAKFDTLAWTHADLQTDLNDLAIGYKIMLSSSEPIVVKGKRVNRAFLERFFTFGMQIFTYFHLKIYLDDINAQPKIFKHSFYTDYLNHNPPNDFSLDLFLLLKAKLHLHDIRTFDVYFNPKTSRSCERWWRELEKQN